MNQPSLLSDLDSLTEPSLESLNDHHRQQQQLQRHHQQQHQQPILSTRATNAGSSFPSIEDEMLLLRLIDMQSSGSGGSSSHHYPGGSSSAVMQQQQQLPRPPARTGSGIVGRRYEALLLESCSFAKLEMNPFCIYLFSAGILRAFPPERAKRNQSCPQPSPRSTRGRALENDSDPRGEPSPQVATRQPPRHPEYWREIQILPGQ